MIRYFVNLELTLVPSSIVKRKEAEGGAITDFMYLCMHSTGVWRLIDKESIKEFFYRLGIILKPYDIIPNFFINDSLVVYKYAGKKTSITITDIIEYFGMEISDDPENMVERATWIEKIDEYWAGSSIAAALSGIDDEDTIKIDIEQLVSNDLTSKGAEYFATEVIKTIGEKPIMA